VKTKLGANYVQRLGRKIKIIKHTNIVLNSLIIKEMCLRDPGIVVALGSVEHSLNTADRIIIVIIIITILTNGTEISVKPGCLIWYTDWLCELLLGFEF
jgi:hypothetical protein